MHLAVRESWCAHGLLVWSPDTLERVVRTRVCLQHLGSRSRFAHAPRIFRERTRWTSHCGLFLLFSFSPLPELAKRRTALGQQISPFDLQHAADPSDVKIDLSTIRRLAVAAVKRAWPSRALSFKTLMLTLISFGGLSVRVLSFEGLVLRFWRALVLFLLPFRIFPSPSATRCLADISLLRSFSARALCRSGGQRNRVVKVRGKDVVI